MEAHELRLVDDCASAVASGRGAAVGFTALLLTVAVVATVLGADRRRRPLDATVLAEQTFARFLATSVEAPEVRQALIRLRRSLGRRPLDARTRVVYAGLLLGLSTEPGDADVAAFHANRAAELAPVTVPVVRSAVLVLAHSGGSERAVELVSEMFGYDSPRAADLLARIEPMLTDTQIERAVPPEPEAALAWVNRLRSDHRDRLADERLEVAHRRWPEHLPILEQLASRAMRDGDPSRLVPLFPGSFELPQIERAAPLFAYRALARYHQNNAAAARSDLDTALQLGGRSKHLHRLVGDVLVSVGEIDEARRHWNRALHLTGQHERDLRMSMLVRLARLEESAGRPGDALRQWHAVLEIDPAHDEALGRRAVLSGSQR